MIPSFLRETLLKKYKPTPKEVKQTEKKVSDLKEVLKKGIDYLGIKCDLFIGGSFGKGTFLKNDFDIDIFCRFDKKYRSYNISELLKNILEYSKIKYTIQKGSRDYFNFRFSGLNIEIIPVFKINNPKEATNTTDISPLHIDFVNKNADEEIKDEIRIAKVFFKAKKLYGAESYIKGFSGHVIDILIIYYKTLTNVIIAAKKWGRQTFIDINNFYKNKEEAIKSLDENKIKNLIIIDPIIKIRNAASALSEENYYKFIYIAKKTNLLDEEDFKIEEPKINKTLKEALKFGRENKLFTYGYLFEIEDDYDTKDIIGAKLLKLSKRLKRFFEENGFRIFSHKFEYSPEENKSFTLFYFESGEIPTIEEVEGPSIFMEADLKKFEDKHESTFLKNDRVYAYKKRKYTKVKEVYLSKEDLESLLGKKLKFIKKIKIID